MTDDERERLLALVAEIDHQLAVRMNDDPDLASSPLVLGLTMAVPVIRNDPEAAFGQLTMAEGLIGSILAYVQSGDEAALGTLWDSLGA